MFAHASYWFRPILSELIGAATETAPINRTRAPSGPVKVSVPTQPQERPHGGISLTSGVAALLAWFPASWASKVVPYFLAQGGAPQPPQEVTIPCPTREAPGLQRDQRARTLQAVRFVDKRAPGINLGIDEDYQASQCFTEVIRGYRIGVIEPATMHSFQSTGPIRVISGNHHTITRWNYTRAGSRRPRCALSTGPPTTACYEKGYVLRYKNTGETLTFPAGSSGDGQLQLILLHFAPRKLICKRNAAAQEQLNPVSFSLENSWRETIQDDKAFYHNNTILRTA